MKKKVAKKAGRKVARPRMTTATTPEAMTTVEETHMAQTTSETETHDQLPRTEAPHGTLSGVGLQGSVKRNAGNYNSVGVTVTVHIPCADSDDAREEAYQTASKFVGEKIAYELKQAGFDEEEAV